MDTTAIAICAGIAGLAVVVVAMVAARSREDRDMNLRPRDNGNSERDEALLAYMDELHVRKEEPHSADFFFYLPNEQSAQEIGAELERSGFTFKTNRSKGKLPWCCEANKSTPVDAETIGALREKFEALARFHHGEYDGWGCGLNEGEGK